MFLPYLIIYAFLFVAGLCVGSFCNVLIYRIPNKLDFVKGRSFCPACGHTLAPRDLVPVISWLLLKGKCRYCGARISPRYCFVELAGGVLAVCCALRFSFTWAAAVAFIVCMLLVTISLIDADTQEMPDGLTIALAVISVASIWLMPGETIVSRLIGMACVSLPMLLLDFFIPTSFGGGDIKLMAAAGFLLGWQRTLLAFFIGLVSGGAYGIRLLAKKAKGRKDHFAFGPFLAAGIAVSLFFGGEILRWYLGLMG